MRCVKGVKGEEESAGGLGSGVVFPWLWLLRQRPRAKRRRLKAKGSRRWVPAGVKKLSTHLDQVPAIIGKLDVVTLLRVYGLRESQTNETKIFER